MRSPPSFDLGRVAWLTDPHLDLCSGGATSNLLQRIREGTAEGLLLGGDIADAPRLVRHLRSFEALEMPTFFVLGNHDFYHSSIHEVRGIVTDAARASSSLFWLSDLEAVEIAPRVGLLGHDGWPDGRYGDYAGSRVRLNDHRLIAEFVGCNAVERLELMQSLAGASAAHLARCLPGALERFETVVVLTHVPPFAEAAWYEGKMSEPDYLPHFSSKAAGDVLLEAMQERPDRRMLVLCGHTHGGGHARILPNLSVTTGEATYGRPEIEKELDLAHLDRHL